MRKLYCNSLKSGWYCVAEYNKEKKVIKWVIKADSGPGAGTKLSKKDIDIIKSALISKKGSLYKSFKDMDLTTLEVVEKKRTKLKV